MNITISLLKKYRDALLELIEQYRKLKHSKFWDSCPLCKVAMSSIDYRDELDCRFCIYSILELELELEQEIELDNKLSLICLYIKNAPLVVSSNESNPAPSYARADWIENIVIPKLDALIKSKQKPKNLKSN